MKNALIFIVIFGLGALCYGFVIHFFDQTKTEQKADDPTRAPIINIQERETQTVTEQNTTETEAPVVITNDGSLLDGPFAIFSKNGEDTGATVRIIRSPEETLLQFENWNETYSPASHVYFASDREATDYFNLGPAKMSEDYLIYGIPLDAKLESYSYILIYQTQTDETEFYAKIR